MDIFKLFGTIAIDSANAVKAIKETVESGEQASGKLGKAFSKLGSSVADGAVAIAKKADKVLKKAAKVGTAAIGAATAGVIALTKAAVDEYAKYEQVVGGAEAVFGECAANMKSIAQDAYSSMGLSATDFLETANKMGALFKGAGFEIQEASDLTAKAMQRAADVASIMGIDVATAMESVAGAAKGNFTMMDNLGVAMTDVTLEAYAMSKGIEESVYTMTTQEKVGLAMEMFLERTAYAAGNYTKENETLSGSLTTLKAAYHNLLVGVSDDTQDFDKLVNDFVDSLSDAADAFLPRIEKSLDGVLKLVNTVAGKILPRVISVISRQIPNLVKTGAEIILALGKGIVDNADSILNSLVKTVKEIVPQIATAFKTLVPKIADAAGDIIVELDGMVEKVGGLYLAFKSLTKGNWIGVGIGLAVAAIGKLREWTSGAKFDVVGLTDAQRELHEEVMQSAEAFDELSAAYDDNVRKIKEETEKTQALWAELQTLCDENGNVKDGYEDRVDYILGALTEATGVEIKLIDGQIAKYGDLKQSIEETIKMKEAERLLEAHEEKVAEADANISQAKTDLADKQLASDVANAAVEAELSKIQEIMSAHPGAIEWFDPNTGEYGLNYGGQYDSYEYNQIINDMDAATAALGRQQAAAKEANTAYNEALDTYLMYSDTKRAHEEAEMAILEGNYEKAIQILNDSVTAQWEALAQRRELSAEEQVRLAGDLAAAEAFAKSLAAEYEAGNKSVTKEMVDEARKQAEVLRGIWDDAYNSAFEGGQFVGTGLANGIASMTDRVYAAGHSLAAKALAGMNQTLQIASPSKAAKRSGKFTAEGFALGIEENEDLPISAAEAISWKTLKAFDPHTIPTVNAVGGMNSLAEVAESGGGSNSSGGVDPIVAALPGKLADALAQILPDMLIEAFSAMRLSINDREFGRLVRKAGT